MFTGAVVLDLYTYPCPSSGIVGKVSALGLI